MSVYIDVWHRTHPLTPDAHARFLDYYARFVVAPPSDFFEVVAGFRYLDGPTNEDFALYRYASMADIEASMRSYSVEGEALEATLSTFAELEKCLPQVRIGFVHGRLSSAEKARVMDDFKARRIEGNARSSSRARAPRKRPERPASLQLARDLQACKPCKWVA